jgi:uncharacterized protein (TIGR02246 family)
MKRFVLFLLLSIGNFVNLSSGQEPSEPSPDETAIRKAVAGYVAAFNKHDAEALAAFWSPEAVYLNQLTGEEVVGRPAITQQFTAMFKAMPEAKLVANTESVKFLSPNVAVEHGTSQFMVPKAEPEESTYSAVYVKREGQWLLDRVTDEVKEVTPLSHYEQLKVLEWMVGRWVDRNENASVEAECKWAKNQNFLVRSFKVSIADRIDMAGMQVIGWDPVAKTIRSWTFDSDGAFAQATWTQKGSKWFISNKGITVDGRKATMVNVMKLVDENSFTWQTIERTVDGELLPNIDEVLMIRE